MKRGNGAGTFFRGDEKILSVLGCAGFARLTPRPNSWHDRGMKVGYISIFRGFHPNPPGESHSPDSADSLIFSRRITNPTPSMINATSF
jgi:hypothetical protein